MVGGDLRDVFDGYALTCVGFDVVPVLRQFGYLNIPDEAVVHRCPLHSAFAERKYGQDRFTRITAEKAPEGEAT